MASVAVFNDTSVTRHHGCNAVMSALADNLQKRSVDVAYYWPVDVDWRDHSDELAGVGVDAIIVNGEGSIHHSTERPRAQSLVQLGEFARERLGVPSFLINATIEDIDPNTMTKLREFKAIYVRETRSRDYLAQHDVSSTFVPDLSLQVAYAQGDNQPRSGVLVTDSVDKLTRRELERFAQLRRADYESMRTKGPPLLRHLAKIKKRLITPQNMQLATRISDTSNFSRFVERVGAYEKVVTGRFHTVTLCLLTQTPVFAVQSNTQKISSVLMDALANDDRLISPDYLKSPGFLDRLRDEYDYSNAEKVALGQYMSVAHNSAAKMFDDIVAVLS